MACALSLVASWGYGVIIHYLVEEPIKGYLRSRTSRSSPTLPNSSSSGSLKNDEGIVKVLPDEILNAAGISPVIRPRIADPPPPTPLRHRQNASSK